MPDLTLSVTAAQWTRIKAAFQIDGADPTAADMAVWVKRQIKARVKQHEDQIRNQDSAINAGLDAEGWND